jgi:hypothetical protein
VLALLEGAVGDPHQKLGVITKGADVVPGDLAGAVAEVVVAELLEPASIASISAFLEKKAASASWLDLVFSLRILAIISGSVRPC